MTISELIVKLQEVQAEHGDIRVVGKSYQDDGGAYDIGCLDLWDSYRGLTVTIYAEDDRGCQGAIENESNDGP